jgi:hypothetical protein
MKIGQVWLIDKTAFEAYLDRIVQATAQRFGPQSFSDIIFIEFIFGLRL